MAMEPITIFARRVDPAGVARRLRELEPGTKFDGPDDSWTTAIVELGRGRSKRTLTLTHDAEWYAEPNWSRQMEGMRGYFSRFPETDRQRKVLMLTTALHFTLGCLFDPDYDPDGEPRLQIVCELAELLDGVLFSPSALRDAQGRVLYGADGEEDPDAKWPQVLAEVSRQTPLGAEVDRMSRPRGEEEYEEGELAPPDAARVAQRAIALTAVTTRAILEQDAGDPNARGFHGRLLDWVEAVGVGDELEPDEWQALQSPVGRLEQRAQIESTWRLEGLVVLAWALGRFEIPAHDELVDFNAMWGALGLLKDEEASELLERPVLRSREELGALRRRLFALHWRLRNFSLRPEVMDFAKFAAECWFGPLDITGLPLVDGDLAVQGERLDRASPEAVSAARSTAFERHRAANWLWEGPERFSEASEAT